MVRSPNVKLPRNIPAKTLRKLIKDEKAGVAEYEKLGLKDIAQDEARHANMLKKILIKKSKQQQQI